MLALVVLILALSGGQAYAYDFTVSPNPPNEDQVTTFSLTPASATVRQVRWDLDNDGDFDDGTTREVQRVYANRGPVTVRMRARGDTEGPFETVTKTITVNGTPTADFDYDPGSPLAGEAIVFSAQATDPEADALEYAWAFDDGSAAAGAAPTHAFSEAGTYDVVLQVTDEHGAVASKTLPVVVAEDPGPDAAFDFAPAAPLTGDTVTFTSSSAPSQGSITALDWDLDGDGAFDDASGPTATWTYSAAGSHLVTLRVVQANGRSNVAFTHVQVASRPTPPDPPADDSDTGTGTGTELVGGPDPAALPIGPLPTTRRPARMRPFPIVRIAGVVLPNGADVTILSVRAPRGATVRARCRGRGCPVGSLARTSATGLVRLRRFERRLRAGITIEIFVRKPGTIGKYTRFLIRAGKPPARVDRCLIPGRERPVSCS